MLTRYTLTLQPDAPCRPRQEWAYSLYSALLQAAPAEAGEWFHQDGTSAISQYLLPGRDGSLKWNVSLLGRQCELLLRPVLEQTTDYTLLQRRTPPLRLHVSSLEMQTVPDVEALLDAKPEPRHILQIQSPAAFKHHGTVISLPTLRLLVQSLMRQWNGAITECPIEDEDDGMEALAEGLRLGDFSLQSASYRLKQQSISGFTGRLCVENHLTGFHRQLADALLHFADYAGIGIKTTLGMGGTAHIGAKLPESIK